MTYILLFDRDGTYYAYLYKDEQKAVRMLLRLKSERVYHHIIYGVNEVKEYD